MSTLPRSNRGRGVTPVKKVHPDDIWRRAMRMMGLEPITTTSNNQSSTPAPAASKAPSPAPVPAPPAIVPSPSTKRTQTFPTESTMKKLMILDLPPETQKEIIRHADTTDLIALSLVSKHFRDLAAEELYRSFNIVFPDEDDTTNDSSFDVLASGLETFVSSEYDYAQYLREITLEPLSGGDKGARAIRFYINESSSGKFMNTLFLMMLRKARSLETFSWDIRVELSRPVFKALHQIPTLQHLRIRLQPGPSTYQGPPAISASSVGQTTSNPGPVHHPPPPPPGFGHPPHSHPGAVSVNYSSSISNSFALGNKYASLSHSRTTKALLPALKKSPPTLSGFKNLKSLQVLDMDTLDYISELRACIRNSSSTLDTLALSFSEGLANKSRKPPADTHSDEDSEAEDDFGQIVPLGPPNPAMQSTSGDGQSKAAKAFEERKKQEDVLQKIFGIATAKRSKPIVVPAIVKADSSEVKPKSEKELIQLKLIKDLGPIAKKLMTYVEAGGDMKSDSKAVLKMIEHAARVFMESTDEASQPVSDGSSPKPTPTASTASMYSEDALMSGGASVDSPGLFDEPAKEQKTINADPGVSNPDDIDIEAPEADDLAAEIGSAASDDDDGEESAESSMKPTEAREPVELVGVNEEKPKETEVAQNESTDNKDDSDAKIKTQQQVRLLTQAVNLRFEQETMSLKAQMEQLMDQMKNAETTSDNYQTRVENEAKFKKVSERFAHLTRSVDKLNMKMDYLNMKVDEAEFEELSSGAGSKSSGAISEYVRNTRGLRLTSLSIYLIPIKGQILARGIDLNVLQNITLLNVGPQYTFWNLLARENAISPLPLNKIYTDNVTLPFLGLIHQLDSVTELLLLEKTKGRVETTAGKTTVTIEHIRKALRKHNRSLKVLMIRHDSSSDWDLNVKTTMMLCQQATELEELSVSFGNKVVHTLLQFISGMTSLRALHTNCFRQEDNCQWVRNNFGKFLIDAVSQNSQKKLEYLALDQNVERLVRRSKEKPLKKIFDKKGKGKAKSSDTAKALAEMVLGPSGTWPEGGPFNSSGNSTINMPTDDWQLSSDEEEDVNIGPIVGKLGLRVETIEGVRFCDVPDVRIFEKDVVNSRL